MPFQPLSGQLLPGASRVQFATPNPADKVLEDILATNAADYAALVTGSPHPDFIANPDHILLAQIPVSWDLVQRVWGKDREPSENSFNSIIGYSGESNDHPIYERIYLVRRNNYTASAKGSSLRGIVGSNVLNGGSKYTQETVTVTLSGGMGSGGVLRAIIRNGAVIGLAVLNEGTYITAPTVTITDSKDGTGATASCFVQRPDAILVSEAEIPQPDSPTSSLYRLIKRQFEVLPGPDLPDSRDDLLRGPVQRIRRAVLNTGQVAIPSASGLITYEAREGSSIVLWEIVESFSDGTGLPGSANPPYPIRIEDDYENDKGAIQRVSQLVPATGLEFGSIVEIDGVVTRITYEAINQFLLDMKVETWTVPGPPLTKRSIGQESLIPAKYRRLITTTETITPVAPDTAMPVELTGDQTKVEIAQESEGNAVQTVVEEVIEEDADPLPGSYTDEQGVITTLESVVDDGVAADSGFQIKSSRVEPFGSGKSKKEVDTYPEFPTLEGTHIDEATGISIHFFKTIVAAGSNGGFVFPFYTEIQTLDKWRSIQIVSSLNEDSLPAPFTYAAQIKHSFPNVIEDAGMVASWVISGDGTRAEIGVTINDIEGYAGPCNARITEQYLTAAGYAAYAAPEITKFWPEDYTFSVGYAYTSSASIQMLTIPVSLHPAKTLTWSLGFDSPSITVPATNPTTLPFGQYIHVAVEPERWRFGVWKVTEIEVLVPEL